MEIVKLRKGKMANLPLHFLGKGGGWSSSKVPEDGLKIKLDEYEWATTGVYVTDTQLRKAGYVQVKTLKITAERLEKNLLKFELIWLAEKLGMATSGTKAQLAQRISENL